MSCKHLMVIEFVESIGPIDVDMVAMFNDSVVSEESVRDYISKYGSNIGYNKYVVFMTKEQYENLKDIPDIDKETEVSLDNTEFIEDLILEQQGGII